MPPLRLTRFVGHTEFRDQKWATLKALLAEFLGTFVLILVSGGSTISWDGKNPSRLQESFAVGFILASMVQVTDHVSGAHLNPAVTFGYLIAGKINLLKAVLYILVQCIASVISTGILYALTPTEFIKNGSFAVTLVNVKMQTPQAVFVEAFLTMVLVLIYLAVYDKNRENAFGPPAISIGLGMTACCLGFINSTGPSLNPARSFGPALIFLEWSNHWIYWVGPFMGSVAAVLFYQFGLRAPTVFVITDAVASTTLPPPHSPPMPILLTHEGHDEVDTGMVELEMEEDVFNRPEESEKPIVTL